MEGCPLEERFEGSGWRRVARTVTLVLGCLVLAGGSQVLRAQDQESLADFTLLDADGLGERVVRIETRGDEVVYYILEDSDDLSLFVPMAMDLGKRAPMWEVDLAGSAQGWFRIRPISVFAPRDTDGDGIDDIYEMESEGGVLDPLNPLDAALDPDGDGMSFLDEYRFRFGFDDAPPQVYSRETSVFNFGSPSAEIEAISKEVSLWNFGSPSAPIEAVSKEVSVYNGQVVPWSDISQVYSREVSVWNFGEPSAPIEAISKEVSVYNGQVIPWSEIPEVYSREVSVFNFGSPSARIEAISREVSVFNFIEGQTLPGN